VKVRTDTTKRTASPEARRLRIMASMVGSVADGRGRGPGAGRVPRPRRWSGLAIEGRTEVRQDAGV
jgi:hypothetical protein